MPPAALKDPEAGRSTRREPIFPMKPSQRQFVEQLSRRVLGHEKTDELLNMRIDDLGFGYDQFGMERESAILGFILLRVVYEKYFRVESRGHENIPAENRAILTANHSGVLPWDGAMVGIDVAEKLSPPRIMRAVVENSAGHIPWISTSFFRMGQVIGHRRNFEELLNGEELVMVFPEGAKGTGKHFRDRYKLRRFNVGFIELTLLHQAPLVPISVIGGEEQTPLLGNVKSLAKLTGLPYFPITPTFPWLGPLGLLPYPTKYHIRYGEPLHYYKEYGPDAVYHPEVVRRLADEVQDVIQGMINDGLRERKGIFR